MIQRIAAAIGLLVAAQVLSIAGERIVVSLRDFSDVEVKSAGIDVPQPMKVHVKALGSGVSSPSTAKSDEMSAYAWIIDAETRKLVWEMTVDKTSRLHKDREFDGTIQLERGSYEVYFAATTFAYSKTFMRVVTNVDHRNKPLFDTPADRGKGFFSFFRDWFSDDIEKQWNDRSKAWGVDLMVDESQAGLIKPFSPPREKPNVVFKAIGLGDNAVIRQSFSVAEETPLEIYALGEGRGEYEVVDYGWIVDMKDRSRVWEMRWRTCTKAGGAAKNLECSGEVTLKPGDYVLYYITDDTHSADDWNAAPPYDLLNWGITVAAKDEKAKKNVKIFPYDEFKNVIVSIVKVRDSESRSEGFTLKQDASVRIYAFGERSNNRRVMSDYGFIIDAKTRNKVWTMDVEQTYHAGGASKNRYVDEIVALPKGSYVVTYNTDDSHAYNSWNVSPPFDPEHYGITIMGAGQRFSSSIVGKYVEEREKNVIAHIVRVGDNEEKEERFTLDRTTRVRIYAVGEGQNREMVDYGWIEDAKTGNVVWEMTYSMTFHAGGARKNRLVNTTILLDKGAYKLRYRTDDSHSYGNWNSDPPEDQQYYGITLYKDEGSEIPPVPPVPPIPPIPPLRK